MIKPDKKWLGDFWWDVRDCIFPAPRPLDPETVRQQTERQETDRLEASRRISALPSDEESLRLYLGDTMRLLAEEQERRTSVESRLTSLMGFISIAGTVVFGGLVAEWAGTLLLRSRIAEWIFTVGALYIALQLFCALMATIRGVSRKAYVADAPLDVIRKVGVPITGHIRERIRQNLEILESARTVSNSKVEHMAVAHRAIENFLVALLIVATASAVFVLSK